MIQMYELKYKSINKWDYDTNNEIWKYVHDTR